MTARPARLVVIAGLGVAVGASLFWSVWSFQPIHSPAPRSELHVRGAIHVHSDRSDGAGSLSEIAAAARDAGMDFVVVTDHGDLDSLGTDEYRDGVLLIKGVEISTRAGHLLALGIESADFRFDGDPTKVLADIRELGGFAVVAHPRSQRPEQAWTHSGPLFAGGIEIMNAASDLRRQRWRTAAGVLGAVVNSRYGLLRALSPNRPALAMWDEMAGSAVPIAGADAHGGIGNGRRFFPFPSYEDLFALFSNHVALETPFSGNAKSDAALVLDALRSGRGFVAIDGIAEANAFSIRVEGSTLDVASAIEACRFVLRRDGVELAHGSGPRWSRVLAEPGIYRIEVFLDHSHPLDDSIPWIVSNRVYYGRETAGPSLAHPRPIPEDGVPLEPSRWETRADPTSRVSAPENAEGSVTFEFTMGDSLPAERRSYCELVTSLSPNLKQARALSFWHRASGVYRFDVQLRDRNPRAADGIEPWRDSVKTDIEWRRTYVSFDELDSYSPESDGRFDPQQAVAIAFRLDTATVRAGVSGRIWIRDVALHADR